MAAEERLKQRRKKLLYRCGRRGMKEMDLLLGGYAERHIDAMDAAALDSFEQLLDMPDQDLFGWLVGAAPIPASMKSGLLQDISKAYQASLGDQDSPKGSEL